MKYWAGKISVLGLLLLLSSSCSSDRVASTKETPQPPSQPEQPTPPEKPNDPPTEDPKEPVEQVSTRIFCSNATPIGDGHLVTLTTRASQEFIPTLIRFNAETGSDRRIFNFNIATSTPTDANLYMTLQDEGHHKVYKTDINFFKRDYALNPIATVSNELIVRIQALRASEPTASNLGVSRDGAFVFIPNTENTTYELRDLKTFSLLRRIQLSPLEYLNPKISPLGEWVLFQNKNPNGSIRLALYSLTTDTNSILSNFEPDNDQLNAIWASDNLIVWKSRPKLGLSKLMATRVSLNEAATKPLSEDTVGTFTAYEDNEEKLWIASTTEEWESNTHTHRLLSGQLKLTQIDLETLETHEQIVHDYPRELLTIYPVRGKTAISDLKPALWNQELIGSLNPNPGMISFSLKRNGWKLHANKFSIDKCAYFDIAPEFNFAEVNP